MANDADLVIRDDLVGGIFDGAGGLWDVRGVAGAGKSVLLREVARRAGGAGHVVFLVEVQDYFSAYEQEEDEAAVGAGAGDLEGELRRFGRALSALVRQLWGRSPEARGALETIVNQIGDATAPSGQAEQAPERARALVELIRREVNGLIRLRAEAGKRVYLLVDTFELVSARPLGEWLLALLAGLDGAVVAVARRAGPGALELTGASAVVEVGGLSDGQVRDYLTRRLGSQGGEIAGRVAAFTGGHALSVGLFADLVGDIRRATGQDIAPVDELIAQLEPGQDDPEARLGRLVAKFIDWARDHDPAVWAGLDCLWAVRRFDFPLLQALLAVGTATPDAGTYPLAERLTRYSFVQRRSPPGRPTEQYYVVHDRVRRPGLRLLVTKQERAQQLHQKAEEFYEERTEDYIAEDEGAYVEWFRYQDAQWQVLVREWLYHVVQLDDTGQVRGRLGLANLFFEAFWWWGQYMPFRFCEDLLTDWAEMAEARDESDSGVNWGKALREMYRRYPKGWRKEATPADWNEIRKQLSWFLEQLNLSGQADERVPRIRRLLDVFLSDAERYLDPSSRRAEVLLAEARELFAAESNYWGVGWVSYREADAALWRGEPQAAVGAADAGWRALTGTNDDDAELAANLHRIYADAAWERGEHGLALDGYARAALLAYKFQVAVGDENIPPIDEYTQAFLTEMHERAAERLAALHAAGDSQTVAEACARIRSFFGPYWRAVGEADSCGQAELDELLANGQAGEVVGHLFPPPPAAADLHQPDTAYALTAGEVLYEMAAEIDQPPGIPLHPATG